MKDRDGVSVAAENSLWLLHKQGPTGVPVPGLRDPSTRVQGCHKHMLMLGDWIPPLPDPGQGALKECAKKMQKASEGASRAGQGCGKSTGGEEEWGLSVAM